MGVEPTLPPRRGSRLPLHHGRLVGSRIVKDHRAPGGTRTLVAALRKRCLRRWITGACSCADGRCCSRFEDAFKPLTRIGQSAEVGPEGLEPSPAWVRTRDAAAQHLNPICCVPVVALRIEPSTTRLSAVSGQPALDYRFFPVGMVGLEPTIPCPRNTWDCRYPTSRSCLPVRTAGFEPAIPWPPTRCDNQASPRSVSSTPWGSRTQAQPGFVVPAPVRWTGRLAHCEREVGLTVLEPVSPGLQPGALPSKLPAQQKTRCHL